MKPDDYGPAIYPGGYVNLYQSEGGDIVIITNPQKNKLDIGTIVVMPVADAPQEEEGELDEKFSPSSTPGLKSSPQDNQQALSEDAPYFVSTLTPRDITIEGNSALYEAMAEVGLAVRYRRPYNKQDKALVQEAMNLDENGQPDGLGVSLHMDPLTDEGQRDVLYKNQLLEGSDLLGPQTRVTAMVVTALNDLFIAAKTGLLSSPDFNKKFSAMQHIGKDLQTLYKTHQRKHIDPWANETNGKVKSPQGASTRATSTQRGHLRLIT